MTGGVFTGVLHRLMHRELVLPYLEAAILADTWPDRYAITIDSSPYYGAGDGYFHPSTHPMMPPRELYFRFHPDTRHKIVQERRTLKQQVALAVGSSLHGILQTQLQMAGILTPGNTELEYVDDVHHVRGRIDALVDHPKRGPLLVEIKTMGPHKFSRQDGITQAWDAQVSIALDNMGLNEGVLLLLEAGWPFNMREFRVPRNDQLLSMVYSKFDEVRACLELNTPPKGCCPYGSPEMRACAARFMCYPDLVVKTT